MASVTAGVASVRGLARDENEDAAFADARLFVVADGIGGAPDGALAARIAIDTLKERWAAGAGDAETSPWEVLSALGATVEAAHEGLVRRAGGGPALGTTLTGGVVRGSEMLFAHVGDSRAYLGNKDSWHQLTEDDTWEGRLANSVGGRGDVRVRLFRVPLVAGDTLLLCTDGIHRWVSEDDLRKVTAAHGGDLGAMRLASRATECGSDDDATCVVVRVGTSTRTETARAGWSAAAVCDLFRELPFAKRLRALAPWETVAFSAGDDIPRERAVLVCTGQVAGGLGPGALLYPHGLVRGAAPGVTLRHRAETNVLAMHVAPRDFFAICDSDPEIGASLYAAVANVMAAIATQRQRPGAS